LKSFVGPLGQIEFRTLLRERKLAFFPGCGASRFETLLNWETLDFLLDSATLPLSAFRVVRESARIPRNIYVRQGRVDVAALSKLLDQGVSLLFNKLHEHVPALRALCKNLARDTLESTKAAAIVTSGRGGALECHYDLEDLIILQIAGTKRWQVFNSPATSPEGPPIFDQTLQPGDLLFLPARYWHHCENGPDRSLHVSLIFTRLNGRQLMTELVSQLSSDETFSRPLTRHSTPAALAEHETALKACLVEAILAISLDRFLTKRAASNPLEGTLLERRSNQAHDVQA
jgi:ribosomal protein L16 Arg81 hydroxylase